MTNFETAISQAKKWEFEEIEKNKTGLHELFSLTNETGQRLAKELRADKNVVMLGTLLMDIKLHECIKNKTVPQHIDKSLKAAKEFLEEFDLDNEAKNKIYNCIESHHKTKEFTCLEAEICANADCYKFLHPKGVLAYFKLLGTRFDNFDEALAQVEKKMEEKHAILSLDICKEELEGFYLTFKELFKAAKTVE